MKYTWKLKWCLSDMQSKACVLTFLNDLLTHWLKLQKQHLYDWKLKQIYPWTKLGFAHSLLPSTLGPSCFPGWRGNPKLAGYKLIWCFFTSSSSACLAVSVCVCVKNSAPVKPRRRKNLIHVGSALWLAEFHLGGRRWLVESSGERSECEHDSKEREI